MKRLGWLGLGAALSLQVLNACGSDDDTSSEVLGLSSGSSQQEIALAYCQRYASELCAAQSNCCTEVEDTGAFSCEQSLEIDCVLAMNTQERDGRVFSNERIDEVFARLRDAAEDCGGYRLPDEDAPHAVRELPAGEYCLYADSGEVCGPGLNCVVGECSPLGNEGDECRSSSLENCAPDLTCVGSVCVPAAKLGENCSRLSCVDSLLCLPSSSDPLTSEGVCGPRREVGEPCSVENHCRSRVCTGRVCAACQADTDCASDRRCTDGACSTIFDVCERDYNL